SEENRGFGHGRFQYGLEDVHGHSSGRHSLRACCHAKFACRLPGATSVSPYRPLWGIIRVSVVAQGMRCLVATMQYREQQDGHGRMQAGDYRSQDTIIQGEATCAVT